MKTTPATKAIMFCAAEQTVRPHLATRDLAGEVLLSCGCGRVIKLPRETTEETLKVYITTHQAANQL